MHIKTGIHEKRLADCQDRTTLKHKISTAFMFHKTGPIRSSQKHRLFE